MPHYSMQQKRALPREAARVLRVSIVALAAGVAVAFLWPIAGAEDGSAAHGAPAPSMVAL